MSILDKMKEAAGGESFPAVEFKQKGDGVRGSLISVPREITIDDKFNGGKKDVFVVNLLLADGTTKRTLWMDKPALVDAVTKAVIASGATDLKIGDTLTVEHHDLKPTDKGNPQKLFRAKYEPVAPGSSVSVSSIFGQDAAGNEEAY